MRIPFRFLIAAGVVVLGPGCQQPKHEANASTVDSAKVAKPAAVAQAPGKAPKYIRGIYLNAYAAGSKARLPKLIAMADSTEINTFVIDVKDEKGVHYPTQIPEAKALAQPGEITITNLKALADRLHEHGIYAIGRLVVFKDPILSKAKPEWSIKTSSGSLWRDKAGNTWVSAWDPNVWEYNIQIAEEVLKSGFDEIQFDYVRFPEPFLSLPPQVDAHDAGALTSA